MHWHRRLRGTFGLFASVAFSACLIAETGIAQERITIGRDARSGRHAPTRSATKPVLAIVSLSDQHVTIYDTEGKALQSPVSTGATGYETPAGIFTIVQKKEMHQSNLYEDGQMPFMQRITWTGIALHAGVLPGHPASHGCIRLPMAFAERLYGLTDLGLRVVIVPDDITPMPIAHPTLFMPNAGRRESAAGAPSGRLESSLRPTAASKSGAPVGGLLDQLRARASAAAADAEAAARRAKDARQAASRRAAEASAASRSLRAAEAAHANAEKAVKDAERALEAAASTPEKQGPAELAKTKAQERLAAAASQLQLAKQQDEARRAAAERAGEEAQAAEDARDAAAEAASSAERKLHPVSVFVSRKAQRLYVRQANQPIYESPVAIRDPEKSIGTFVFTAVGDDAGSDVRWNVVSMYKYSDHGQPVQQPQRRRGEGRGSSPIPADVAAAKSALDRISMPKDAIAEVSDVVLPGASLIISDEAASIETGKDTDFVVVMSGEPQGALKIRQREPLFRDPYDPLYGGRRPKGGWPFSFW